MREPHLEPVVAVILAIWRGRQVLFHKRKSRHGRGKWAFPGGHLEHGDSFEYTAERETVEECGPGLVTTTPRFWTVINSLMAEDGVVKHYVVVVMTCEWIAGEPVVVEPDKCECWEWHDWDKQPSPLMPSQDLLRHLFPNGVE